MSRMSVEGTSDASGIAALRVRVTSIVVTDSKTDVDTAATAVVTEVAGSEMGEGVWDKLNTRINAARDAGDERTKELLHLEVG
jgi:hypothetical protein